MLEVSDPRGDVKISARDISKSYGRTSPVTALEGVNLDVRDGEFVCIVGPSGCGKSTLLRMFATLLHPSAGAIEIQSAGSQFPYAMVFQNYSIFPWKSVEENIGLPLRVNGVSDEERHTRVRSLMAHMGLSDFAAALPGTLSGGMAQRVSIARALAVEPEILLMDEPFAAVDAQMRRILQDELLSIWQEDRRTVVFVTHSLDEAILLGDRVVVMSARPGKVIASYDVPFERPRRPELRGTKEFAALEQEIWSQMRVEVERSER